MDWSLSNGNRFEGFMKTTITKREYANSIGLILIIVLSGLPAALHLFSGQIADYWLSEDGIYEAGAAFGCILISGAILLNFLISDNGPNLGRSLWLVAFALTLLFLGGEEISWGQRIFGFDTPEKSPLATTKKNLIFTIPR